MPLDDVPGHIMCAVFDSSPVGEELPAPVEEPPGDWGDFVGRRARGLEGQTPRHGSDHRRRAPCQPQRRRAGAGGSWGQRLVEEQPTEVVEVVLEDRPAVPEGNAPRFEVVGPEPGRDDEHESAARHPVQRVGTFGEPGRIAVCLVALPPRWGIPLLAIVAGAAGVGMGIKLVAFGRLNVTSYVMYPALGWVSVVAMPVLVRHLSAAQLALILAGGLAYTVGMVVLWRRWPDPRPRRFGYHEVWHLFTIVAAALHFAAVASVVR